MIQFGKYCVTFQTDMERLVQVEPVQKIGVLKSVLRYCKKQKVGQNNLVQNELLGQERNTVERKGEHGIQRIET